MLRGLTWSVILTVTRSHLEQLLEQIQERCRSQEQLLEKILERRSSQEQLLRPNSWS